MTALLLVATALGAPIATSTADAATSSSCGQSVRHDAFLSETAIEAVNETGEATSSVSNTEVRVEDATGFIRIRADNPNGYCVSYSVEISSEIVAPADLGTIESNNGSTPAKWRAVQNLSSGGVYTRVTFVLDPGENATWAPSSARVESLAWTGQARETGGDVLGKVKSWLGGGELEKNNYEIRANESSRVTVPLSSDNKTIEDWQATYSYKGETRPVTQDASAPVYYSESGNSVTFHFSERARESAVVHFTANPSPIDSAQHSWRSYWSGADQLSDWLPLMVHPWSSSEVIA